MRVRRPDLLSEPAGAFARGMAGAEIDQVGRRGKNVVWFCSPDTVLVINLGMTGRLLYHPRGDPAPLPTHTGVTFDLAGGDAAIYSDARRFGRLRRFSARSWRRWSRTLGLEPLSRSFTARRLAAELGRSRSPIRSWLLDQRRVAGIGNIYANEALFLAGIHPALAARAIPAAKVAPLHRAIRRVLRAAIAACGTTLRDYRDPAGLEGSFGPRLVIYGREGQPCVKCPGVVLRTMIGNRSAFHCPHCQPPPQ